MSVTSLIPVLPSERPSFVTGIGATPQPPIEVITQGSLPGAEIMLQKLLEVRGEIGGPDQAKAEREARVRQFHSPPVTYDGFGAVRRPPTNSVYLVA